MHRGRQRIHIAGRLIDSGKTSVRWLGIGDLKTV